MSNPYELKPTTIARAAKYAKPFVDTLDDVINRALDAYEGARDSHGENSIEVNLGIKDFDPATPPNLTHTRVLSITFNGTKFEPEMITWNALLFEAIRIARKKIRSDEELDDAIVVNYVLGKKEVDGYRFLEDANLSVQGQDANGAWRGAFHIARKLGLTFDVVFVWREKESSTHPGLKGRFFRTKLHTIEAKTG
jgi:hypothetical protein